MTRRTQKRRNRAQLRVVVALAFLLWSTPSLHAQPHRSSNIGGRNLKRQYQRWSNESTVRIKCRRAGDRFSENGAGVIISKDGHILTACHVIEKHLGDDCTITV